MKIKKETFFKKIFKALLKIFKKKPEKLDYVQNNIVESQNVVNYKNTNNIRELYSLPNFSEINSKFRIEQDKINAIEEIIKIIEKEPKSLKNLNIQQLEVIDNYYSKQILKYKAKISKLS